MLVTTFFFFVSLIFYCTRKKENVQMKRILSLRIFCAHLIVLLRLKRSGPSLEQAGGEAATYDGWGRGTGGGGGEARKM